MANILNEIVARKQPDLAAAQQRRPLDEMRRLALAHKGDHSFFRALDRDDGIHIIAEIKKASPSKGVIRESFDPVAIAQTYTQAGAAAISVLTEEHYFQGSLDYLSQVRSVTSIPVLRKDFLTEPYQVYEARVHGADAVLLIAALLTPAQICAMLAAADELGMDCLVEVHSSDELRAVLSTPARIIGVNNRDLTTFKIDMAAGFTLAGMVPSDRVVVVESGIHTHADIEIYLHQHMRNFLVGEALMKHGDIAAAYKELTHGKN